MRDLRAEKGTVLLVRHRRHPVYGSAWPSDVVTSPRILGIATFTPGRRVHAPKIRETDELNPELQAWLGEVYDLGRTRGLGPSGKPARKGE